MVILIALLILLPNQIAVLVHLINLKQIVQIILQYQICQIQKHQLSIHHLHQKPQLPIHQLPKHHRAKMKKSTESMSTIFYQPLPSGCFGYKLVGDNIDKNVYARYMRIIKHQNRSLHFFHALAILDRVDISKLSDMLAPTCLHLPKK